MRNQTEPSLTVDGKTSRDRISPLGCLLLALWLGLCAGYLDVGIIVAKRFLLNPEGSYRNARDFPWMVPVGHLVLAIVPGVVLAAWSLGRRGRGLPLRPAVWSLTMLALWFALLRLPLHPAASLMLAFGVGLVFSDFIGSVGFGPRQGWVRKSWVFLIGLLLLLAASSTGRRVWNESRSVAALPSSPGGAKNVVLIVLDTVRASSLSLYGYPRETTPNLARWAERGVKYNRAIAPAPWTFPSHACYFTGRWPLEINAQCKYALETPDPTLAEFLSAKGYQTAGFVANTNCCNYETGLDRGFLHFEDYAFEPRSLLSRTVPGRWLLEQFLIFTNPYERKWVSLQSRGAKEVNDSLFGWLDRRRDDRPFFAFVNYFDAHEPFIAPSSFAGRVGVKPTSRRDYQFLVDYVGFNKARLSPRDYRLALDAYDDCIAALDFQVGRVLDELERRKMLDNTVVVVTSDHGEAFAEHGYFGHSYSVHLEEEGIPLLIFAPKAPKGLTVYSPVSLRDFSATVIDLAGLPEKSPFPGRSLAAHWAYPPGKSPDGLTSVPFSEMADASAFQDDPAKDRGHRGYEMSLVALGGFQYIRDAQGNEQLFDLWNDPFTRQNVVNAPENKPLLWKFRAMLLETLREHPGTPTVEKAYLKTFRDELAALLQNRPRNEPAVATAAPDAPPKGDGLN